MNRFELNHLKYFYFTVLEGGVGPAAKRIGVQQPVISKMLKILEEDLDEPLFYKSGRKKELTDFGQKIFRKCQGIFQEIQNIEKLVNKSHPLSGTFSLGASEVLLSQLFIKNITNIQQKHPELNINLHSLTFGQMIELLTQELIDIGVCYYMPNLPSSLEVFKEIPTRFHLVVAKKHINDTEVLNRFIGSREIDNRRTTHFPTLNYHRLKYPKAKIALSSNSLKIHKELVLKGCGISILPDFLVKDELKRERLKDLYPEKKFEWGLKFIKRKASPTHLAFEEIIPNL